MAHKNTWTTSAAAFDTFSTGIKPNLAAALGPPHAFDAGPIDLFGLQFIPIRLCHGKGTVYGFRFGNAAYLTDHSDIPEESMTQLCGLDVLFLDALRHRPHPTHSTVERSLESVEKLSPRPGVLYAYLSRSGA